MQRKVLFINLIFVFVHSIPVFNDFTQYETGTYKRNSASIILDEFDSYTMYTFMKAFQQIPQVIYFKNKIQGFQSCIGREVLVNEGYLYYSEQTSGELFTCRTDFFIFDSSIAGIASIRNLEINYESSIQQSFVQGALPPNYNISHTVAHILCSGYRQSQSNSYYFTTSVAFDQVQANLTLNWSGIEAISFSLVFFDLSLYHFYQAQEFFFTGSAAPPANPKIVTTIGILGFSNIRYATNISELVFDCSLTSTYQPQCIPDTQPNPNKVDFLVLYIRNQGCSELPDPHMDLNTCLCDAGYSRPSPNELCVPVDNYTTMSVAKLIQRFNEVQLFLKYSNQTKFLISLESAVNLYLDNILTPAGTLSFNGTVMRVQFTIESIVSSIKVMVQGFTVKNFATSTFLQQQIFILQEYFYFYRPIEQKLIAASEQLLTNGTKAMSSLKSLGIVFGGVCYLLDTIEFTQQAILYLFLDLKMPKNFRAILQALYFSSSTSFILDPLSIQIKPPFPDKDDSFTKPQIFQTYGFSFNFFSDNAYQLLQIFAMIVFYHIASFVGALIPRKYCITRYFGNYMRRNYTSKVYSNSIDCFLSCQLSINFAAVVVFLDRSLLSSYKIYNLAFVIIFVFISGIISTVFHTLTISSLKKSKKANIENYIYRLKRDAMSSKNEQNIFMRYFNNLLFSILIPLTSSSIAIVVLFLTLCFEGLTIYGSVYEHKFYRYHRLFEITLQVFLHVCLFSFWVIQNVSGIDPFWNFILGYVAIGLTVLHIASNFLIIVLEIFISIFSHIFDLFKQRKQSFIKNVEDKRKNQMQMQESQQKMSKRARQVLGIQDNFKHFAGMNVNIIRPIRITPMRNFVRVKRQKVGNHYSKRNQLIIQIPKL